MLPVVVGVWLIVSMLLDDISPFLGWAWNVVVLYFTLGFKYFSDTAERIARLLRAGDVDGARARLEDWRRGDTSQFSDDDLTRVTIEQVMAASHRQMFGVLFWFVLLVPLGPVGAVLFRECFDSGATLVESSPGRFRLLRQRAFHAINWLPARLTALTYAIAGNFEDAMYCWRTQASAWPERGEVWCLPRVRAPWACAWDRASTWAMKPYGGPTWVPVRPPGPRQHRQRSQHDLARTGDLAGGRVAGRYRGLGVVAANLKTAVDRLYV